MSCDLSKQVPILIKNDQEVKTKLCAKFGYIVTYLFIT